MVGTSGKTERRDKCGRGTTPRAPAKMPIGTNGRRPENELTTRVGLGLRSTFPLGRRFREMAVDCRPTPGEDAVAMWLLRSFSCQDHETPSSSWHCIAS